jgi:hypothetical protein
MVLLRKSLNPWEELYSPIQPQAVSKWCEGMGATAHQEQMRIRTFSHYQPEGM